MLIFRLLVPLLEVLVVLLRPKSSPAPPLPLGATDEGAELVGKIPLLFQNYRAKILSDLDWRLYRNLSRPPTANSSKVDSMIFRFYRSRDFPFPKFSSRW